MSNCIMEMVNTPFSTFGIWIGREYLAAVFMNLQEDADLENLRNEVHNPISP